MVLEQNTDIINKEASVSLTNHNQAVRVSLNELCVLNRTGRSQGKSDFYEVIQIIVGMDE